MFDHFSLWVFSVFGIKMFSKGYFLDEKVFEHFSLWFFTLVECFDED